MKSGPMEWKKLKNDPCGNFTDPDDVLDVL